MNEHFLCEETLTSELIVINHLKNGIFSFIEKNKIKILLKKKE
ncbi:MAG: hypothetical protein ACFYJF_00105 [Candidatus Karelsulcia muelleri]